jgi:hypothetical protein
VPFIQCLWPDPPPIVPVLTGSLTESNIAQAAAGIAELLGETGLLVVSTDFTHYGPRYGFMAFPDQRGPQLRDSIRELDMEGVRLLESFDGEGFARYVEEKRPTICGRAGLAVMARLFAEAPGARTAFLGWSNSSERTGDFNNCVSYVAMGVYASDEAVETARAELAGFRRPDVSAPTGDAPELTSDDREALVALARASLERAVRAGSMAAAQSEKTGLSEALSRPAGAFVTLKTGNGLRGCIGHITADTPMADCVERMAAAAALRDPRFPAVQPDELEHIKLEISVLSPLEPLPSPEDVEVGRDGLIVRAGRRSGLLLPQVPVEQGWDREEFLRQTCRKAGLPATAWTVPGVEILRFTATVFGEE